MSEPLPDQVLQVGSTHTVHGYKGSAQAHFATRLLQKNRPLLLIVDDLKTALEWKNNLDFFQAEKTTTTIFPAIDTLPYFNLSPHADVILARIQSLWQLSESKKNPITIATLGALSRRLMSKRLFEKQKNILLKNQLINRDELVHSLVKIGYERSLLVEDPGSFAIRGGILDIFSPAHNQPCRLELAGDEIESLRFFNPSSQKSSTSTDALVILPCHEVLTHFLPQPWKTDLKKRCDEMEIIKSQRDEAQEAFCQHIYFHGIETYNPLFYGNTAGTLFDYIDERSVIIFCNRENILQQQETFLNELESQRRKSTSLERIFKPAELFLTPAEIAENADYFPQIDFTGDGTGEDQSPPAITTNECLTHPIRAKIQTAKSLKPLAEELDDKLKTQTTIFLVAHSTLQKERLTDLLRPYELPLEIWEEGEATRRLIREALACLPMPPRVHLLMGSLATGFYWPQKNQWWLTDEEIFGHKAHKKPAVPEITEPFLSFSELKPQDFVVHQDHGIGQYKQLQTLVIQNIQNDFIVLEYAGGDKLYVPVDQLDRISRHTAAEGHIPLMDRLGGTSWLRVRERVKRATRRLAKELLTLQAIRASSRGFAFSPPDSVFEEFAATFAFDETADQEQAILDVLRDMQSDKPMDRLICGDVGYGKTEVALRAAFKAVLDHKQVAVLVPTTVLAFQHFANFKKRLGDFAVQVDILSRFQSAAEQKQILEKLQKGETDIVVGTHRLLSRDIEFADLGLLVIDEEQHFGVGQKEKIKKLKNTVDTVTLSATPIPRTLNFALVGIRDLSLINTPPVDRHAIRTYVTHFDEGTIREAITREIARGGQVYFVHNRVQSIHAMHERLKKILPQISIRVAHGQMAEHELEKTMVDFMENKFQVLVCTTIIESGLDIPNVNTIILNRADHLGLSQLYQLRGRVGRSHHRAYCYCLIPHESLMTDVAKKRLQVLQRFTELGSGFKIATHDLEIRGAGNILGPQQSGQIAAVGYDLYVKLLEEAIHHLKGDRLVEEINVELKLPVTAAIPDTMVPDTQLRLVLYKQLSSVKEDAACLAIQDEWTDRFGSLPPAVLHLITLMRLKLRAKQLRITAIQSQKQGLLYQIHRDSPIATDYFIAKVQKSPKKYQLFPDGRFFINEGFLVEKQLLEKVGEHLQEMQESSG